jgi:membrane fusion protein (multidrug efflux system)
LSRQKASPRVPPRLPWAVRQTLRLFPVLALPLATSLVACSPPAPPAPTPPQVQLINPRPVVTTDAADYQSTLEAIREVRLSSEIAGRIVAMPVYEGQPVKPGQLLFALDQVQQRATVNANAAEARKNRLNAERYIFLNQQGAVSTKERDAYVTQAIQSRDALNASLATLAYKNVVAPIPGSVGNLNFKMGDVIQPGQVVTSVVDNSRLWVRIDVPGELADRVRPGLPVVLKGPDPRRPKGVGRVIFVAPALDKERQTLLVKAEFDNRNGSLRNNERVNATVVFNQQKVLAIPQQAVLLQAGKTFVFVAVSPQEARQRLGAAGEEGTGKEGGGAARQPMDLPVALQVPVELGTLQNGVFPVRAGLSPGDQVVVGNLAQLRSGLAIQPRVAMLQPAGPGAMAPAAAAGGRR